MIFLTHEMLPWDLQSDAFWLLLYLPHDTFIFEFEACISLNSNLLSLPFRFFIKIQFSCSKHVQHIPTYSETIWTSSMGHIYLMESTYHCPYVSICNDFASACAQDIIPRYYLTLLEHKHKQHCASVPMLNHAGIAA